MTARITSARDLCRYLAERFRRDGCFLGGVEADKVSDVKVDKGELILPIGPELERFCTVAAALRQKCDKTATSSQHDFSDFANQLNHSDDDWRELSENALNDERKANRARERALKRSRRNTKSPKKKGKRR